MDDRVSFHHDGASRGASYAAADHDGFWVKEACRPCRLDAYESNSVEKDREMTVQTRCDALVRHDAGGRSYERVHESLVEQALPPT